MHSTRQIFDRLAHSSIMRLNESSMDKLFDLMTMGFKYQLLACSYPEELLHVTLNHLAQLRSKVADAKVVVDLVDEATRMAQEKYSRMSPAAFGGSSKGSAASFRTSASRSRSSCRTASRSPTARSPSRAAAPCRRAPTSARSCTTTRRAR